MSISKFIPYTNKEAGFNSIVPEGWFEGRPGEFRRGDPETDPTFLLQQGVPGANIELVIELLLPKLGLEALPERAGGIENVNLSWDLYAIEHQDSLTDKIIEDIALTEGSAGVYVVLFGTTPDEYNDMHYTVFLRLVDRLTPASVIEVSKQTQELQKTDVDAGVEALLIKGAKLENEASDVIAEILQNKLKLHTGFVDLDALDQVDLQDVKLLFFPGGESAYIHLSEKAARQVRHAVAAGMGYIGICAGAFLAAEAVTTASHIHLQGEACPFGIFPGLVEWSGGNGIWPFYIDVRHSLVANSSAADGITSMMHMRFAGGTSNLVPSYANELGNWCVATIDGPSNETSRSRRAIMTATIFGEGRVFLSGPHPEAQEDTHGLIQAAAEWCTGKSDPVSDQPPIVVANIPISGIVNHFTLCSAAGSHDPLHYPIGFTWDFGDRSSKQYRPEAVHIYEKPGTYTITLTVTTGARRSTRSAEVSIME